MAVTTCVRLLFGLLLGVLVATSAQAGAQQQQPENALLARAREAFEQARIDFDAGRFEEALAGFDRAYQITRSPEILYNIGVCHDRLRRDSQALAAFDEYLSRVPEGPDRQVVERRVETLRQTIAAAAEAEQRAADEERTSRIRVSPGPEDRGVDDGGSVLSTWWFWTIAGVVLAAVVVGAVLAGGGESPPLVEGDGGGVIFTLRAP